ncbi:MULTISPECIES: phage tail protein [unclassified Enterobacter]|uniref:phage tail protein n=1 Tax=unclassified Enterobacter TaxID=2608935 RepID=UPI00292BDDC2|nr:phage tail protein [Enterobacter sp. 23-M-SZ-13]MDV0596264.1 phage tail protein [Enterobacter sp. 23-M-SZ-13]
MTTTIIKGRGKGGSNQTRTPVEAPDSIQSIARAKVLIALGEGEFAGGLDGKNIFLGDSSSYTPLQNADGSYNFNNVKYEFRSGTQDQDYIQGFPGIENELQVSYELKQAVPYVRAVSNTQLSALRIRLGWPTLLLQKNNGDKVGTRVEYAIDLSVDGGPYETVVNGAVDDKTTSLYERSHRVNLPKASTGWQLRVRRITPDSTSVNIVDTMRVVAVTEIIDAKLRYVNTALLYVEFDAKQFPNGIPQVVCNPKGRIIRVPDTYDPETRTYSGTWEGVFKWAWTDNPAWIYYDIILNERFGLGQRIDATQIDKWELYRIAQYCDQLVPDGKGGSGTEPRFRCNVYIQDRNDAWTVLRDLAGIFRGMTYWGDNKMYVLADMPRDVWHIYNHASVVEGKFTFADPSETTRNTAALVNWSDPANHYKDTPEPVYDSDLAMRFDYRQLEMTAIGCTRQSEANRRGRWALLTNGIGEVVTFSTGMDVPPVGEVIGVAANELAGRTIGGRVSAVNGRNITLDRAADVKAGNRLFLNLPSGTAQARTVQAVNGNTVTVTTPYSETPEAECNWGVDSDDLFIALFRVTGTRDNNDGTFEVTGTTYNPDIYSAVDTGARLDERPVSVIPPGVQAPPGNIVVDSYSTVNQNIAITTMRVAWDSVQGAVAYEAEWRRDSGNWISVPRTSSLGFEVQGIYSGRYLVRVRAVNASDVSSVWATSSEVNLTGKVGNPPKPVGFIASDNVVFGIELSWGFPANTDDTLKTEIQYSPTGTEDDAMLLADVPYPQRKYQQMGLKAGQIFWYRAQLVDRSGNESGYTGWVRGQASIDVSDITDAILEDIKSSEVFKDLIEDAVASSEKLAELSEAIKENADGLAAAVGSNKQTAEAIIGNALAIADVVVRQTAQQGANSATFEQLREVIATETEARVTDVTRLEAKTEQNEAGVTEVRQALATEAEARASEVSQLTAATKVASDKADSAAAVGAQNTASITNLSQVVTDLDSSMASRLEELGAKTDKASGGIQNNAIALITSTLAQVNQRNLLSVQYGDNKASIERVDNVMADASKAVAESLRTLDSSAGGNTANVTDLSKTLADFTKASAAQINSLKVTVNGQSAAIIQNSQVSADINNNLSAMYNIKVAVDANGRQYAAGMGIGVENTPAGMQSQVLFLADRFAVMTQAGGNVTLPFVIQNGQTIIRDTVIGDGTIGNLKIGSYIQSTTWDGTGNVGWHINKSGYAVFNNVTVRGMVYASGGKFTGTIEATSFVGDIANVGVGSDASLSGTANLVKNITYTDSGSSSLAKNALVEATFYSSVNADSSMNVIIDINGTSKTFSNLPVKSGAYANNFYTFRFGVKGINASTVTATLTIVNVNSVSKVIYSPSLTITRGTGSFVG